MADTFEGELDIIGIPNATIAALKTFPLSAGGETRKDGSLVYVVATEKLYRWNATSTATPDDINIVQSDLSATGRWLATAEFVNNVVHTTGNETINGQKTFEDYTKINDDCTIGGQCSSGSQALAEDGRFSVRRKSDNLVRARIKAEAKSEFPDGITLLPDGVDPTDAATVNQIDTHVHEDTKYQPITVGASNDDTFPITEGTPDLTAPFTVTRNGNNTYYLGRGDFTVVDTTLTWERGSVAGDGSIPLTEGDTLDLLYNIQQGTGTNIKNVTEKGFGLNVKHVGENTWYSSETGSINLLYQVDDTEKLTYIRVAKDIVENTEITPANSNLNHVIAETGYMIPHAGIVRQPFSMALVANTSIVRDGSTVTVENPSAVYINNGCEVLIQGVTPGDYNGTWTVTSIDPDNEKFTYDIGSATPGAVTVLGTTTFHYDPNPLLNNRTVIYEGTGKIILKANSLIPEGYNFDIIKKFGGGASVSIYPMGTVVVKGMYDNINNYKTWESISSTVPIIPSYGTVRLFYRGDESSKPTWYIQYSPVTDETRV